MMKGRWRWVVLAAVAVYLYAAVDQCILEADRLERRLYDGGFVGRYPLSPVSLAVD